MTQKEEALAVSPPLGHLHQQPHHRRHSHSPTQIALRERHYQRRRNVLRRRDYRRRIYWRRLVTKRGCWCLGVLVVVVTAAWMLLDKRDKGAVRGSSERTRNRRTDRLEERLIIPPSSHDEEGASPHPQQQQHPPVVASSSTSPQRHPNLRTQQSATKPILPDYDVIVVGSGLAGLVTTLEVLDRGGHVALVEKESSVGGNSLWASSGINGCCRTNTTSNGAVGWRNMTDTNSFGDSLEAFVKDTERSAGIIESPHQPAASALALAKLPRRKALIETLVSRSASTLQWLEDRLGMDLSQVSQLGGHSFPRTYRPAVGMVGAELVSRLFQIIQTYPAERETNRGEGTVSLFTNSKVTQIIRDEAHSGGVSGVLVQGTQSSTTRILRAPQVVIATGGFASDRRSQDSLLAKVRSDLLSFGTTGGSFSTGDGITLVQPLGAETIDMEKVQLHPTGFVHPDTGESSRDNHDATIAKRHTLAAELLRGVGGLLINRQGQRFCNELGTRDYVTQKMLQGWNATERNVAPPPAFALVLTEEAATRSRHHVNLYQRKGLLTRVRGVEALATWMQNSTLKILDNRRAETQTNVTSFELSTTFQEYQRSILRGRDSFGKTVFPGFPTGRDTQIDWEQQTFYAGMVTPVLHYCMGGIAIDINGHVITEHGKNVPGLFAAGEVTGGIHGNNRLAGNSLLDCAVTGRVIGQQLDLRDGGEKKLVATDIPDTHRIASGETNEYSISTELRKIGPYELQKHSTKESLWMAINGFVYDLTEFAGTHPGGDAVLLSLAGLEASAAFNAVHSEQLLRQFSSPLSESSSVLGQFERETNETTLAPTVARRISFSELRIHSSAHDCWVAFHGNVYDMTEFSRTHKGGPYIIQKYGGKDATEYFKAFHKKKMLDIVEKYRMGILLPEVDSSLLGRE